MFAFIEVFSQLPRRVKIRTRLIVAFIVISLIPLSIIGYIAYQKSSSAMESKITSYSMELVKQMSRNLNAQLQKMDTSAKEIQISQFVQEGIPSLDSLDELSHLEMTRKFDELFKSKISTSPYITNIIIETGKEKPIGSVQLQNEVITKESNELLATQMKSHPNQLAVRLLKVADGSNQLVAARNVNSTTTGEYLGRVEMFIKPSLFTDYIKDVNFGDGSTIVILDLQGKIIASKDGQFKLGEVYKEPELIKDLGGSEPIFSASVDGVEQLVASTIIEGTDYKLVAAIPYSYLNSESNSLRNIIVIVAILCFISALLLAYVITNGIALPLNRLVNMMSEAKGGNLAYSIKDIGKDEISAVISNFNDMVRNISLLIMQVNSSTTNVLKSAEEITISAKRSHSTSVQVGATIEQIAVGSSQQAEDIAEGVNALFTLSEHINRVEEGNEDVIKIVSSTKQVSENALVSVKSLKDKAVQTNSVSVKIISDINNLSKDINEIQKITEMLSGLSSQTTILSLNASIEAARAGQAGRGFAVVANEVKKLATQSTESSKLINAIITRIKSKMESTVKDANSASSILTEQMDAVRETEDSFKTILNTMSVVSDGIEGMSDSIERMVTSREAATGTIENIAAVAEETAATTEEVAASIQEQIAESETLTELATDLQQLADNLGQAIAKFKIEIN
ncbi:methyl-accepting chemotaxis protein [Paenibacillus psychroresistens]|uniref:Methyl-accepting chemotaxis protein n=1 Tax=Paenibacillus psychroresistens TaxID=1778678 RepID=A0A6B8RKC8_9BACL|nr:methyl-accepting chemotaxis protein [Paenibacillus psychroresistens]QGQ96045.1 methyl-accepting chemotaxis protein [Paenibacillus psychroresistens]